MPNITPKTTNRALWTGQVLLAALFLFAGGMKLVTPIEAMQGPIALPGFFLRFIGVVEILGGLGLVLPGLFRIHQALTPLAACGLVGVMAGATVLTAMGMGVLPSLFPFAVGLIALAIAYGRGAGRSRGRCLSISFPRLADIGSCKNPPRRTQRVL